MTEPDMTEVSPPPGDAKIRLGKNYWKLWSASVVSNLGDGVALLAYPWLASAVTRDPFLIALIVVAQRLPWLVFSLPAGVITDRLDRKKIMMWSSIFRTGPKAERKGFWVEIKEGMAWLWAHPLLRPLAIILGLLNGLGSLTIATFILFAQEVLRVDAFTFALIGMAGAVGGAIGAVAAPRFTKKFGAGTSLYVTLLGTVLDELGYWPVIELDLRRGHDGRDGPDGISLERHHGFAQADDHP